MSTVQAATGVTGAVRFALPYDLDAAGNLVQGRLLVTDHELAAVADGQVAVTELRRVTALEVDRLTRGGRLVATTERGPAVIVEFTARLAPRYRELERALVSFVQRRGSAVAPAKLAAAKRPPRTGAGRRVLAWVVTLTRPYRGTLALVLALYLVGSAAALAVPQLTRILIDRFIVPGRFAGGPILGLLALIGAVYALRNLSTIWRNRATARFGAGIAARLREAVFDKIQSLPLSFLTSRSAGDLATAVSDDTRDIRVFVQESGAQGLFQVALLIGLTIVVLVQDWRLGLLILAPAPVIALVSIRIWRMGRASLRPPGPAGTRPGGGTGRAQRGAGGKGVRSRTRRGGALPAPRHPLDEPGRAQLPADARLPGTVELLLKLGEVLVLLAGGWLVLGDRLQLGVLVQFAIYAAMLHAPLQFMGRHSLARISAALSDVEELRVSGVDSINIRFDPRKISAPELVVRVSKMQKIRDLSVTEPGIEEIITRIYQDGRNSSPP